MEQEAIARLVGPENVAKTVDAFEKAIAVSFLTSPARMTRAAVKERVTICLKLLIRLRKDFDWSLSRIYDHLTAYLRNELEGVAYTPSKSTMWSPDEGAPLDAGANALRMA